MAHIPVNHHLRPLYRSIAALTGLYILVFGIVGFVQTRGLPFFTQDDAKWVLFLRTNPAFSVLSILAGAAILVAQVIGRNLDHYVNMVAAVTFAVVGTIMMLLLQTNANVLAFSMVNVIVSYVFAFLVGTASLYDKSGSTEAAHLEETYRHYGA